MTIFLLKSMLSLLLLGLAGFSMYTMLTVFGREKSGLPVERLKARHAVSGYLFLFLVLFISYLCIGFTIASRLEPTPRGALHALLALSIMALLLVKVLFVRTFRRFYDQARTIGIVMFILSFVMVGLSGGYYLAVSKFGRDRTMDRSASYALRGPWLTVAATGRPGRTEIRSDRGSIERGRTLFNTRCVACHDPFSTRTIVGPGLQGMLRRPALPASGRPATAENVLHQLRQPLGRMPSFAYLSDSEREDLLAYLNTL